MKLGEGKVAAAREQAGKWLDRIPDHAGGIRMYDGVIDPASGIPVQKPVRVKVAGSLSDQYREAADRVYSRDAKIPIDGPARARHRAQGTEIASECILEWEGVFDNDGTPLRLTAANALLVLRDDQIFDEYVQSQILEHAGFTTAPSAG